MAKLKVTGICGSLREGSYNRMLLHGALQYVPRETADASELGLRQFDIPVYNGDIEALGLPETVVELKQIVEGSDVLLIASPEYNYSITPVLKNFIDWLSRGRNSFRKKTVAIMSASTGQYGGVRGQEQLRLALTSVNALLLPQPQIAVKNAGAAFAPELDRRLEILLRKLVEDTVALAAERQVAVVPQ